jgi:hypothetical protein
MLGGVAAGCPEPAVRLTREQLRRRDQFYDQPARWLQAKLQFAGGITNIIEQTAAENKPLAFSAATTATAGFAVLSAATAGGVLATTKVHRRRAAHAGKAIAGTATLPTGATISASLANDPPSRPACCVTAGCGRRDRSVIGNP